MGRDLSEQSRPGRGQYWQHSAEISPRRGAYRYGTPDARGRRRPVTEKLDGLCATSVVITRTE
jgi:hypothetical protein